MSMLTARARDAVRRIVNRGRPLSSASAPLLPPRLASAFSNAEPRGPCVKHANFSGPKTAETLAPLRHFSLGPAASACRMAFDIERSVGNYIVDADGDTRLDMYSHIASIAVGYNNEDVLEALSDPSVTRMLANRPALGVLPCTEYPALIERLVDAAAPPGLNKVISALCGTSSNENAIKLCFMRRRARERGFANSVESMTEEDARSALASRAPGCPPMSILSFGSSFHGRSLSMLAMTHTKPIFKLDMPLPDWPHVAMPEIRYPLPEHAEANAAEEDRCIASTARAIDAAEERGCPVAGMIIEPVQAEGGDVQATPRFYRALRALALERGVGFICDEVQTGVHTTGKMWAHEHWDLASHGLPPPDIVTFAKKMQTAGLFTSDRFLPDAPFRIFNTWMGDPVRVAQGLAVLESARSRGMVENTREAGAALDSSLRDLSARKPGAIANVRGRGTFLAFDLPSPALRDAFVAACIDRGLMIGPCGPQSVRLRPMLCFTPAHAEIAAAIWDDAVAAIDA